MNGRQRGWAGWLFLLALAGGGYVLAAVGPIYANDYAMKNVMRGALNDYIAFLIERDALDKDFTKRASEQKVDIQGVQVEFEVDEGARDWAKAHVTYERTWQPYGLKKTYKKTFKWTAKEVR